MRSNRMKVAFVSFDFGEYSVRLASAIAQDAETLLFLPTQEAEPYTHLLSNSVDLRSFRKARLRQPVQQLQMLTRIAKQIRDFNPDVIHLQSGHLWLSLALPLLGNCPVVLTVHDASTHPGDSESGKTPQWILDRACQRAQARIVHAPQVKQSLVERLHVPEQTVHVVPHILIGDDMAPGQVSEDGNEILFFGRIWPYKGLEYLVRAEPLISAVVPNVKIVIAGTGEDMTRYREMMVHPERFVVLNEHVSDETRSELIHRASIVVLPYIEASQSGVIPLAYRAGKPVVATTVGGLPAMVDDGQTGYLVPPRDSKALADAVVRLLQDRPLRTRLGENGRRKVNTECAPEVVAEKTLAVYREVIDGGRQVLADLVLEGSR